MAEQDKEKLITLLDYLIRHNGEHSEELKELADKTKVIAAGVAQENMLEAARLINESNEYLKKALMELNKD